MIFKLIQAAAKTCRRLNGENQLPKLTRGVKFRDGIEADEAGVNPGHAAARRSSSPNFTHSSTMSQDPIYAIQDRNR